MPRVSVLIITRNRAHVIEDAIKSAVTQAYKDWELIVVDDESDDATPNVVRAWSEKDNRIKFMPRGERGPIAVASNFGLKHAQGEYIAILDDDDYWADPDKLKKQVEFLDSHTECVGCGGGIILVNEKGGEIGRILKPEFHDAIVSNALFANPMANSTTLFRKEVATRLGNYDEGLKQFADWDFWLKMGKAGKLYNFQEYFAYYRMWATGASFSKQREAARAGLTIIRRYRKQYKKFPIAILVGISYFLYAHLPEFIKRFTNSFLSRLKKALFSR